MTGTGTDLKLRAEDDDRATRGEQLHQTENQRGGLVPRRHDQPEIDQEWSENQE